MQQNTDFVHLKHFLEYDPRVLTVQVTIRYCLGFAFSHSWLCNLLRINTLHVAEWSKQPAYYVHIRRRVFVSHSYLAFFDGDEQRL